MRIGTAGWSIPRESSPSFPGADSQLERYARVMNCVEINSSFYRSHRAATWTRWAAQTPEDFRFAVKLPRAITHDARLRAAREALEPFLEEAGHLGAKLGPLLVQLPPSLAFEPRVVGTFFRLLRRLHDGAVVCEPRHASWFTPAADRALVDLRIGRAAADPARWPEATRPGGWLGDRMNGGGGGSNEDKNGERGSQANSGRGTPAHGGNGVQAGEDTGAPATPYWRWHGSPRLYGSRYDAAWLAARAKELSAWPAGADRWCIFDNTAAGAALANALELRALASASSQSSTGSGSSRMPKRP